MNLPLQLDRSDIKFDNHLNQGDWDAAGTLKDLPGHLAPALALRQGAFANNKVVSMQGQLLGTVQTAADQKQTHITLCHLCGLVNPAHKCHRCNNA